MAHKRDKLSKLDYGECQFRGGYEIGYSAALSSVRAVLELAGKHVQELEKWSLSDPSIEAEAPALSLETAA